jgi:hypothetical protein
VHAFRLEGKSAYLTKAKKYNSQHRKKKKSMLVSGADLI